jgi:hypothetical protein
MELEIFTQLPVPVIDEAGRCPPWVKDLAGLLRTAARNADAEAERSLPHFPREMLLAIGPTSPEWILSLRDSCSSWHMHRQPDGIVRRRQHFVRRLGH